MRVLDFKKKDLYLLINAITMARLDAMDVC